MENNYKLKYGNFFCEYLKYQDLLILCLKIYLKMYSIEIEKEELISLIHQVKDNMKNKSLKKLKYEFHDLYCALIENVVGNCDKKDIDKYVLDNYGIAQIRLCSIVVEWIKTKDEVQLNQKEINQVLARILKFILKEYGEDFLELLEIIGLYNCKEIGEVHIPKDAILNASIIIKNVHPNELNGSINAYILKNEQIFDKFKIESLQITCLEKNSFIKEYKNIIKMLNIVKRMKTYKIINRLAFFNEFHNEIEYLPFINLILSGLQKEPLIDLKNEKNDINLVLEKNEYLIQKNKELSDKCAKSLTELKIKIKEADELKAKADEIGAKAEELKKELSKKKQEIKNLNNLNSLVTSQLVEVNSLLNESKTKIKNHLHREVCGKIENYFYNIISPLGREEINKELENKNNQKNKINIYLEKIDEEYPNYFKKIKKEGIDCGAFLYKINSFRKENNSECHDSSKVNYNTTVDTLNNYFNKTFDFKKYFEYMFNNFDEFRLYLFNDDYKLGEGLYSIFQKKEQDIIV